MFIRLEKASGIPITRQITDQVRTLCATGALQAGDQLPSVRQLAHELAVNQNTILRVYERLEQEGWIERRHGSGSYVAGKGSAKSLSQEKAALRLEADRLARHAGALGMGLGEIREMVSKAFRDMETHGREGKEEK